MYDSFAFLLQTFFPPEYLGNNTSKTPEIFYREANDLEKKFENAKVLTLLICN